MSRDGFAIADVDTGIMADPKILCLARRLRDSAATMAAVGLYHAVVLASWKAGERVTLEDSAPAWWLDPIDEPAAALVAVGLLDDEHRIPEHAWDGWFAPARDRRQRFRDLGAKGGRAKAEHGLLAPPPSARSSERSTARSTPTVPTYLPTVPTDTATRADTSETNGKDERYAEAWRPFLEAWHGRGFAMGPTVRQRVTLWPIVDSRPNDIASWVRSAPEGAKASDVVAHVLREWRRFVVAAG